MANIVFDLGGVVVAYDRAALLEELYPDPATHAAVRRALLEHPDWTEMDRGALTEPDAIARAAARSGMPIPEVGRFIDRMSVAWRAIPETVALMQRLRAHGHALFCLSNMHPASLAFLERAFTFWDLFAGQVISCRVGLCKPEAAIYAHLLARYGLLPDDTIFIDDRDENLAGAASVGMRTVHFADPAQCARALRAFGVEWP